MHPSVSLHHSQTTPTLREKLLHLSWNYQVQHLPVWQGLHSAYGPQAACYDLCQTPDQHTTSPAKTAHKNTRVQVRDRVQARRIHDPI